MNDQVIVELLGIKCHKSHANTIKKALIMKNLLNNEAKSFTQDDYVIFPLEKYILSSNIDLKLELDLDTDNLVITTFSFSQKKSKIDIESELQKKIPNDLHHAIPKSYDLIGDILLVKLKDEILDYKEKIAETFLSSLNIASVYFKTEIVQTIHRIASWECIGGECNTLTTHRMNDIDFLVDIKKVYFNPRLNNEYLIVSDQIADKEIVWDLFCGIGAFTLTLAIRKEVTIHSNDINHEAIHLLEKNIEKNKKKLLGDIITYNTDTNNLIKSLPLPDRIFMNLPEKAKDFIPELLKRLKIDLQKKIIIYLYHFAHKEPSDKKDLTKNEEIKQLLKIINQQTLDNKLQLIEVTTRIVRVVSPSKTHFVSELTVKPKNDPN